MTERGGGQTRRRFVRNDNQGSVAIEFAMLVPLFLMFVIGLIELGFINWASISMARAAEAGSQYLVNRKEDMQNPSYAELKDVMCAQMRSSGLSCSNLSVAVFDYDDPSTNPVTLPKPIVDKTNPLTAHNFILALGYNWTFSLISTPLLVPSVNGVRQLRRVTYVATAERPIE